jgi:hypothetical protein
MVFDSRVSGHSQLGLKQAPAIAEGKFNADFVDGLLVVYQLLVIASDS